MTLQQKVMNLIGQWQGTDSAQRPAAQQQLAEELISLVIAEAPARKAEDPTPFCAFCAARQLDNLVTTFAGGGRKRSAA